MDAVDSSPIALWPRYDEDFLDVVGELFWVVDCCSKGSRRSCNPGVREPPDMVVVGDNIPPPPVEPDISATNAKSDISTYCFEKPYGPYHPP